MKKPAFFSIEDGCLVQQAGQDAVKEWVRRYRLVNDMDFGDAELLEKLFKRETALGALILPYNSEYAKVFTNTRKIGRYLIIPNSFYKR